MLGLNLLCKAVEVRSPLDKSLWTFVPASEPATTNTNQESLDEDVVSTLSIYQCQHIVDQCLYSGDINATAKRPRIDEGAIRRKSRRRAASVTLHPLVTVYDIPVQCNM